MIIKWLFLLPMVVTTARNTHQRTIVDQLRYDFLTIETDIKHLADQLATNKENDHPDVTLIKQYQNFDKRIKENYPYDFDAGLSNLDNVWTYQYAYNDLRALNALYETFRRFQDMQTGAGRIPSPQLAWIDLTRAILDDNKHNVSESLKRIEFLIKDKRLFSEAAKEIQIGMFCESQQSPQQVILNLYNAIAITELKGYTMVQFAYMLKKLYGHGNYTKEYELTQERYLERTKLIAETAKKAMEESSNELWRCDPKRHVKGQTYEEITQLLQGYIQNEVDLNPEGTCRENCAEYQYTKSHGCYQNQWCNKQRRCNGKIVKCQYIDSDMWVCPSSTMARRYEYVEYENGRVLGRKQSCKKGTTKVDSWWRWVFWHCSYCFCLCDESGPNSDRYINLKPHIANIDDNRVVTGLRFTKTNRIIHLQIQEGELLPRGRINSSTVRWVPLEDYRITDRGIRNGQDYHTLSWEQRAFDLDDLIADEDHVVTGVQFKLIGSHLNFEIYTSPFDFETGRLIEPKMKSVWRDNPNTDSNKNKPRSKVRLVEPDVSTNTILNSIPDSRHDQFIEFENTDMGRDAAQSTVPFFDTQPVNSLEPVPLSGAGIFHKGQKHFGGFITPKIMTLKYGKYIV